jgi:hypothetical protein
MPLQTDEQYITLGHDIRGSADMAPYVALGENQLIAEAYNVNQSPVFWVTRSSLLKADFLTKSSPDSTLFVWAGNGMVGRSVTELLSWGELWQVDARGGASVDPRLPNIQPAINDIFSGVGNAAANRAHYVSWTRREARRVERVFATGVGSVAALGTLVYEGTVTSTDVAKALRLTEGG